MALIPPRVVNVKVVHLRRTGDADNVEQWLSKSGHVYIGRAMRVFIHNKRAGTKHAFFLPRSPFANTFSVKEHGRDKSIQLYRCDLERRLETDNALVEQLKSLSGAAIGCWCHPQACHGDVLVELFRQRFTSP